MEQTYRTKTLFITSDIKMADVILNHSYIMLLLEHFGIKAPLQEKTVKEMCLEYHINTELFLTFANLYSGNNYEPTLPFSFQDILTIVNYLRNSHKYYLDEIYPGILNIIKLMSEANTLKEMLLVEKFFIGYFNEVTEHLNYENNIVFPYIIGLYGQMNDERQPEGKSKYSVKEYQEHHNDIEDKLADLKNLLIKYLPQQNDQPIRRRLLFNLFELEYDLNIHSQIEDLILIPLVSDMELHVNRLR